MIIENRSNRLTFSSRSETLYQLEKRLNSGCNRAATLYYKLFPFVCRLYREEKKAFFYTGNSVRVQNLIYYVKNAKNSRENTSTIRIRNKTSSVMNE